MEMPHWEEARQKPKKTFTQYRWTDTVIEGWVLVEDKSGLLDEHGKSKVCVRERTRAKRWRREISALPHTCTHTTLTDTLSLAHAHPTVWPRSGPRQPAPNPRTVCVCGCR